jgi:hypothetical protein
MSEAETIEQLIGFTDILLAGLSVFFTIVSAYIAALNYFIRRASFLTRAGAFFFFSFVLGMLILVMVGARRAQWGLVGNLEQIQAGGGQLSPAGDAMLANARSTEGLLPGVDQLPIDQLWRESLSLDGALVIMVWLGFALTYLALFLMTFVFRWGEGKTDDATA